LRGQDDLVDFQSLPDEKYKCILNYQDHYAKCISVFSLESKQAAEVTFNLSIIFLIFSTTKVLQSDNGKEYIHFVINEIKEL
jgi:hypothetical protein